MTPETLSLSNSPGIFIGIMLVKLLVVFTVVMLSVAYATWCERKVIGHMQTRLGPMRTGWHGLLQPFADGIKLFFKEDIIPTESTKVPFLLAPMMILVPALITVAVIPFGGDLELFGFMVPQQITDLNVGVLYILAFAGLGIYGIVLAGWASNSKYALLGGVRATAQMISYELAAGLTIIAVFMLSETLSLREIVTLQQEPLWGVFSFIPNWYVFTQPLAFGLFIVTGLAEINRTPFDMPEAESELVSGFCTEYSSMKYALFFMAEYANMIVLSGIAATLFLGGWSAPFNIGILNMIPGFVWLLAKIYFLMFCFMWLRATFPRVRYDQLMRMGWKFLLPLALANVVVTGLVVVILQ
jgi:NADH-quinone oxidoreductase subunit H